MDSHNDALEALRHAAKRLDKLAKIEQRFDESERRHEAAEAELAALGTEVMYCVDCAVRFRYIPGVHQIEYCFTCLGRRALDVGHLEEQIAELHREIEFIDAPIIIENKAITARVNTIVRTNALRESGWLLILMATDQRRLLYGDDLGVEFCCSDAPPPGGCWGDIACEPCGGCALHCACEAIAKEGG
jgi:hypothetical protein